MLSECTHQFSIVTVCLSKFCTLQYNHSFYLKCDLAIAFTLFMATYSSHFCNQHLVGCVFTSQRMLFVTSRCSFVQSQRGLLYNPSKILVGRIRLECVCLCAVTVSVCPAGWRIRKQYYIIASKTDHRLPKHMLSWVS